MGRSIRFTSKRILEGWDDLASNYAQDELEVRGEGEVNKKCIVYYFAKWTENSKSGNP